MHRKQPAFYEGLAVARYDVHFRSRSKPWESVELDRFETVWKRPNSPVAMDRLNWSLRTICAKCSLRARATGLVGPDRVSNPDFLLGGRTSASAKCRHWSEGSPLARAILLRFAA